MAGQKQEHWKWFGEKMFEDYVYMGWFIVEADKALLTHWGRVMHICVSDLTIIGSDNGLLPGWRQAIIRTNAGILLIRPLGTNFSEILIKILIFSFKKMRLKVSSAKSRPLSSTQKDFSWRCHLNAVECNKMQKYINVPSNQFST